MELGPATKIDKKKDSNLKKLKVTSSQQNVTPSSLFRFMKQFEEWIRDSCSVTLTFLLIITFYLTKTENKTNKPLTQLLYYCQMVLVLKVYFLKLHLCVYLRMKFKICSVILMTFRQQGVKAKNEQVQGATLRSQSIYKIKRAFTDLLAKIRLKAFR